MIAGIVILALLVWFAVTNVWMFVFVVGILVSVFLHEMGHFVTARLTGMKATQFFLGFGPRLWSFHRGETEYGVRALPLGAFVRIIGMNNLDDVPPEDEARTYRQQSYPKRMLVITAGSLMHMLIAIVLLFSVFSVRGELVEQPGVEVAAPTDGPAAEAGIRPATSSWPSTGARSTGRTSSGPSCDRTSRATSSTWSSSATASGLTIPVGLGANADEASATFGQAFLGVSSRNVAEWQEMSLGDAAVSSVTELFPTAWESTKGIVQVFNPVNIVEHLTGESEDLATRPTTVVGITAVQRRRRATGGPSACCTCWPR